MTNDVSSSHKVLPDWFFISFVPIVISLFNSSLFKTLSDKLKILSQSKISVVHGLWRSLSAEGHMQFPRASENLAFSHLDEGIGPQVKSRMFEAAFSRCVILCQRDYWNPIELWFEPEKEFMYFDNEKDLDEKINYIINHYDEFDDMRINAYNKAINNYTTKHFVDRYLK